MSERKSFLRATTTQALTSAALSYTTTFSGNFKLCQVFLKASAAITETITLTLDSKDGSTYDILLDSTALSAAQNYVFRPQGECIFMDGDELVITCTAANTTGIVYVTIIAEPLGLQP